MSDNTKGWNPLGIANTIELGGNEPLGDSAWDAMETLMEAMEPLKDRQRVVIFQVLHDFFCPWCGREQPPGDCQCWKDKP